MKNDNEFHLFMPEDNQQIFNKAINSLLENLKIIMFNKGLDFLNAFNNERQKRDVIFLDLFMSELNVKEI